MKITQTIEITIKDQTLILTKEEAQLLADTLYKTLGIKAKTTDPLKEYEKFKQREHHQPIHPVWPQNPHKPQLPPNTFDPVNPYPWKSPIIWCQEPSSTCKTQ